MDQTVITMITSIGVLFRFLTYHSVTPIIIQTLLLDFGSSAESNEKPPLSPQTAVKIEYFKVLNPGVERYFIFLIFFCKEIDKGPLAFALFRNRTISKCGHVLLEGGSPMFYWESQVYEECEPVGRPSLLSL